MILDQTNQDDFKTFVPVVSFQLTTSFGHSGIFGFSLDY